MTAIKKLRKRRALSPVIATVILVAVALTVAVAVSYWMSGIAGQYTAFEKVEIQSAYAKIQTTPTPGGWIITLELKNSGSATANLMTVFVNEKPVDEYAATDGTMDFGAGTLGDHYVGALETGVNFPTTGLAIESGKLADVDDDTDPDPVKIYIGSGLFSSGTTINIKLHSAGGMDYIKLVRLT